MQRVERLRAVLSLGLLPDLVGIILVSLSMSSHSLPQAQIGIFLILIGFVSSLSALLSVSWLEQSGEPSQTGRTSNSQGGSPLRQTRMSDNFSYPADSPPSGKLPSTNQD